MNRSFRRIMSFLLTLAISIGTIAPLSEVAHAGVDLGGGTNTGGGGQIVNADNGGFDYHMDNLNFRVSVQRSPEFYNDGTKEAKDKVVSNFSYKYPSEWGSEVYFLNHACVSAGSACKYDSGFSKHSIMKYDPASGDYIRFIDSSAKSRMFALSNTNTKPANLYKDALLKDYSYHDASKKDINELKDGKWKNIAHTSGPDKGLKVWSYILYPTGKGASDVNNRLMTYISPKAKTISPTSSNTDKEDVAMGYLDLMMTMWKINFEKKSTATSYWEQAIEDYIKVADPQKKPVTIVIDVVALMQPDAKGTSRFFMPMVDYFQLYTGIRSGQDFMGVKDPSVVGSAKGSTKSVLETLVNKARKDKPNWGENWSDQWSNSTWNWGAAAIMAKNKRFITYNRKPAHYNGANGLQHALWESLYIGDNPAGMWGFTALGFQVNDMSPQGIPLKLIAKPDNEVVSASSEIIGKQVSIDLQATPIQSNVVNAWASLLKNAEGGKVNVKLHLKRDGSLSNGKYSSSDGGWLKGVDMTVSDFTSFLKGTKIIKLLDDTTNIPIGLAEKKIFTYEARLEVNWSVGGKKNQWLYTDFGQPSFDLRDTASFIRPGETPDPMFYNNYPLQYAEVKEGTPDNETFEAMAGVPSTERLYFGAGGTEFVVDVELEYEKDKDSVWRTYQSYFTGTPCEHKTGDQCGVTHNYSPTPSKSQSAVIPIHGSAPPPPGWYGNDAAHGFKEYNHTAVSDGINRQGRETISYSQSITAPKCGCSGHGEDDKGNSIPCPQGGHCLDAAGSISWSSSVSSISHMGCGPCHTHDLPQINDTWKQKVNIDYIKINKVEVYKLTEGRLTPVNAIFGDNVEELRATPDDTPTIFYNIAQMNAGGNDITAQSSLHGRLRYTLEPQMHDIVVWNEGVRTNKCDGGSGLGQGHSNTQGIVYNSTGYSPTLNYHVSNSTSYDKARPEWQKFDERRKLRNNVTVISDMLILQTSSGDKSAMYFTKEGVEISAQEQFADVSATKQEMWDSNANSASKWTDNEIPLGSYNGNFQESGGSNRKYWGYSFDKKQFHTNGSLGKVSTIFDNDPAKTITRTTRPGKIYMYKDEQIERTIQNQLYDTGDATIFYERILAWTSPNPYDDEPYVSAMAYLRPLIYTASAQGDFGGRDGFVEDAFYSPTHVKVNDIIIHTPVTTENAIIIGLPEERDQRTETPQGGAGSLIDDQNKLKICPLNSETCDFRVLNCDYLHDREVLSVDFDSREGSNLLNKVTNKKIPYTIGSGMKIEPKSGFGSGDVLHANGTRFSMDLGDVGISFDKGLSYLVEMDFLMPNTPKDDGTMIISFEGYSFLIPKDSIIGGFTTSNSLDTKNNAVVVGEPIKLGLQFSFGHILDSKVFINGVEQNNVVKIKDTKISEETIGAKFNIGSWGKSDNFGGGFYIDNLKVTKASGGREHTNACYIDTKVHGVIRNHEHDESCYSKAPTGEYACSGLPLNAGGSGSEDFAYTGGVQKFVAPSDNTYTFELWGASGGDYSSTLGSKGTYVKQSIDLKKGDEILIYVGQKGLSGNNQRGGWNGGGTAGGCSCGSSSGGGATDVRFTSDVSSRIVVAGGGGGVGTPGNAGLTSCSVVSSGHVGATGDSSDGGGGGGGYRGGASGGVDRGAYIGSSYVDGAERTSNYTNNVNTVTMNNNSGNGKAKISWGSGTDGTNPTQKFTYTGDVQTFTVPKNGSYNLELWGAQGNGGQGGKGGYAKGTIELKKGDVIQLLVGGQNGYNGGGVSKHSYKASGGGATDIRLNGTDLSNRIIVAGGGGGGTTTKGGDGGALNGGNGANQRGTGGGGGTQTAGGIGGSAYVGQSGVGGSGALGVGGINTSGNSSGGDCGGGGYYGGGAGGNDYPQWDDKDDAAGGGGSSYIGGVTGGITTGGQRSGNGEILISWEAEPEELHHEHTASCPRVGAGSLVCGYNSDLNVLTDKNSHVHDSRCGTYNGWSCYNSPLNDVKEYTCNNLPLNDGFSTTNNDFNYTGGKQTFTAPGDATYVLEVWGAQGASKGASGGLGGYSKGDIVLKRGQVLNLYVGGTTTNTVGGWNGGGSTGGSAGGGGGATDIRLDGDALTDRIVVAGGGGGAQAGYGGAGGGLVGEDGEDRLGTPGRGGTQTAGGAGGGNVGTLGQGGNGLTGSDGLYGGAGGGGYYGGGGAISDVSLVDDSGGGGGSSYYGGVNNGYTQAKVQSGNGKIRIVSPSLPTTHTHNGDCSFEFTEHKHGSSCSTVKEYSCGGQVKNAHTDVTDYTGGNRVYGAFANVANKSLSTTGVKTTEGALRIGGTQVINGPKDEYYAGTYLVTIKGKDVHNANVLAKDDKRGYAISKLNTENPTEVKYILGVTDETDNLEFNISANIGVVEVMNISVEPITLREPMGLCAKCQKHVTLKSGGTKVQCSECSADLFDFEEKINFMASTLKNAEGERQVTVFGAGNKVGVLKTTNGYEINEDLSKKPDRNFEPYFKYDKAVSSGCTVQSTLGCTEPHHKNSHYTGGNDVCWDACGIDANHVELKDEVVDPGSGDTLHSATFINLDYGFRMYFPNRGDFAQDTSLLGITAPTSTRGQGYIDDMPTTKYTERKSVTFEFNVIFDGVLYLAGERIDLDVSTEYFDFYCVLANGEALGAEVEWEAVAINGRPIGDVQNDNYGSVSNKTRYSDFTALHGGYKQTWVDVVGRIGNFTISDTDDFRFSNFFKQVNPDGGWLIEGILPEVYQDSQNNYYGDLVDIRGERASADTRFLNTYGSQKWAEKQPYPAPINPKDNNVVQLREKFLRVGYDVYSDITTIGDYQKGMVRALPYYYFIDLDTNSILPLDVYMKENSTYELINQYSGADDNEIPIGVYHQNMIMNWEKESARRNYMLEENLITDRLSELYKEPVISQTTDDDGNVVQGITGWRDMDRPRGNYTYQGVSQRYVLDSTSKTYIGNSKTYEEEMNIGGKIDDVLWEENAQRWHLKFGLPSSAVFVETGKEPTQANIDDIGERNGVVLNCVDIISLGKTYTLRWQQPGISSFSVVTEGNSKTYDIKNLGLPPVIALYEAGKTSVDDITINGTH